MPRRDHWDYYPPARPRAVKDGIKARSQRGDIGETWWSRRWISALESLGMGARLARGRSYARRGQVASIDVGEGRVTARVQGTRSRPYTVTIGLRTLSREQWATVEDAMASRAVFAAKLLSGEMPPNIEAAFEEAGVHLLPRRGSDLETECSCPDWANPCKHIAAVHYLLAERFDEDPFLIFRLRGRSRDDLVAALRERRARMTGGRAPATGTSIPPAEGGRLSEEELVRVFWRAGEGLDRFTVSPSARKDEGTALEALGPSPFTVRGRDLSEVLGEVYRLASDAASRRAVSEVEPGEERSRPPPRDRDAGR